MVATLRIVLDQVVDVVDADVAEAGAEIARALVATTPTGCEVAAIVPADAVDAAAATAGFAAVTGAPLARAPLTASWQLGIAPGIGGGLVHAPSLQAPLVRHDRAHDGHQIVVTVWDLGAWESRPTAPRAAVLAQRALLKRAEKHADAVVVPAHALAARLSEIAPKLASRIRVISGAAPTGFRVPTDAIGRRRHLGLPDRAVVVSGVSGQDLIAVLAPLADVDLPIVVFDPPADLASAVAAAGLPPERVHPAAALEPADRAAVWDAAHVHVAGATAPAFPWRAVEALTLGVPVVAAASPVHDEVLHDGALRVAAADLGARAAALLAAADERAQAAVRAADRGRAFSWRDHAERVWALHAEL